MSNPFWEDQPTNRLNISGTVTLENRVTDVPVHVWIEDLSISGQTGANDEFSIDIPDLETDGGSLSGAVRVFYYVHNYRAHHSVLNITDGKFSSSQTDFDEGGRLLEPVILERLASFDVIAEDRWDRSVGDSLRVTLEIRTADQDVSIMSNVKNIPHDYIPSGVLFYLSRQEEVYFDQNNIDYLMQYDLESFSTVAWTYTIAPNDLTAPPGDYYVRPFFIIRQDEIPEDLIVGLGIAELETISGDHLNLPIDLIEKTISIE